KVSDSVQGKGIWKVQSLRRSADNVGEMPQLASIPGCQSGGSQEIGRAQNSAILATGELYDPAAGTFTLTGSSMTSMRWFHTATLLPSGKVLFVGGVNEFSGQESPEFSVLWSAGLFDPNSTSSLFTGGLGTQRFRHAAALLNNGHRMGRDSPDSRGVTCTSLYVRNCGSQQPLHYYLNQRHHVIDISGPDWNARSYA